LNSINGGSLRCYATHAPCSKYKNDAWLNQLKDLRRQEFDLGLDTDKPYKHFQDKINVHGEKLLRLLKELKQRGNRIHIYGASTKGNTILQWCNIDNRLVECAADRNPDKHGACTLGTDIPIISEEESRAMKPDYYLVLPWHFLDEFLQREQATMQNGTAMIFPLPEVRVYKWSQGRLISESI
ncbi:MAG TPA: methyltransferase C-terminal domain-containing protein, partial [Blastocatellia bacterium]|nr:methyltransferase C-terminal domain-containing protein [Blastocatellia bacterium]